MRVGSTWFNRKCQSIHIGILNSHQESWGASKLQSDQQSNVTPFSSWTCEVCLKGAICAGIDGGHFLAMAGKFQAKCFNLNEIAFPETVLLKKDGSVQVAEDTHYQFCVNYLTLIQQLAIKTAESCSKKKVKEVQASQCRPSQVNCFGLLREGQKQGSPTLQNHRTYQSIMYGSNICKYAPGQASIVSRKDSLDQFPSRLVFMNSASSESNDSTLPGVKSLA